MCFQAEKEILQTYAIPASTNLTDKAAVVVPAADPVAAKDETIATAAASATADAGAHAEEEKPRTKSPHKRK